MVVALIACWGSIELFENMQWHFYAGYSLLTLLLFRIIWGFIGTRYARFGQFLYPLSETLGYAKNMANKNSTPYLGHNPIGSLSVLLILLVLSMQVLTGLFNSDDYFFGPLNGLVGKAMQIRLSNIHSINFDIIKVVIAIHIIAVLFYRFYKKQTLTTAMLHGKKNSNDDTQAIKHSKLWLALIVILVCASCVYGMVSYFESTLPAEEFDVYRFWSIEFNSSSLIHTNSTLYFYVFKKC